MSENDKGKLDIRESSNTSITKHNNIIEKQERTRSLLAIGFSIWYGALIFLFVVILVTRELSVANANVLTVLLSGSTGFVWTILWFYFGQNSK